MSKTTCTHVLDSSRVNGLNATNASGSIEPKGVSKACFKRTASNREQHRADKLNYVTWEELGPLCSCVPQVSHAPSRLTFAGEGCKGSFKGYLSSLLPTAHA